MADFNCGHGLRDDKVRMYDTQGRTYEFCSEGCRDLNCLFLRTYIKSYAS